MNPRSAVLGVVALLATVCAVAIRGTLGLLAPISRFWRLASLKARVDGTLPVTTQFDGAVESTGRLRLHLGEHCRFGRRVFLETCEGGIIRMGANVRINSGAFIVSYAGISIGRDTLAGEYVTIRDADHGMAAGQLIREQPHSASRIRIGEGVWIGRGAVILKGVTIGDGAVIAANSVVTRDIRAMAIVAGTPAREIRLRSPAAASPEAGARADSAKN